MKKTTKKGPIFIAIAATLWAFDGLLRRSLYSLPPVIIVFYEHIIGSILLIPLFLYNRKKLLITREFIVLIFIVSLLSGLLGTLLFTTALIKIAFIPFSVVILLQKLQPVFAITAAYFFLHEKITKKYLTYAFVALLSAYFVTFPNGKVAIDTETETFIAALYALGAAAAWGTSTVFSRKLLLKNSVSAVTTIRFFLTSFIALIAIMISAKYPLLFSIKVLHIKRLILIAVSTGMVALYVYYQGLQYTKAKIATIIEFVFPLLAIFIDVAIFHTTLTIFQYIAAGFLLFSIYKITEENTRSF